MASFTEFKLDIGIKNDDRDTEFSSILKSLIKELYTTYGIALTKDILSNTETINSTYDTTIELTYKNIVSLTISGYTEDVDYTIDKSTGELVLLSNGSMTENTDYLISYEYYLFINESNTHELKIYPDTDTLEYHIDIKPYTLNYVKYDGEVLTEEADYYEYNHTFELVTAPTSARKPYILNLDIGYEEIPSDLKHAFYELANIRFDMKENKTYLISRVADNSQGTSTSYRMDSLPTHIKRVLEAYSGRRFVV